MSQAFFVFIQEDASGEPYQPEGAPQVLGLSWGVLGGCERAELAVPAQPGTLRFWQALLGKPVQILNKFGSLVWWGYVHAVAQPAGSLEHKCSLEGMANRVAVAYTSIEPAPNSYGEAMQTDWAVDRDSSALYGQKDLLLVRGMMAESAALQLRDEILRQRAKPELYLQAQPQRSAMIQPEAGAAVTCDHQPAITSRPPSIEPLITLDTFILSYCCQK